jgi:cephalosporin hydroxylase
MFSFLAIAEREMKPSDAGLHALAELYYGLDGNRKHPIYLAEYERLFAPIRKAPLRLLELGVNFGASMFLWSDYFPNATIVGLDIADRPARFPADKRVHFVQGGQDDPAALDRCLAVAGGPFDIIVDDASHIGRLSAASFAYLFLRALKPRGFYVIEDICTAFLPGFVDSEPFCPPPIGLQQDGQPTAGRQAGVAGIGRQLFDRVVAPAARQDAQRFSSRQAGMVGVVKQLFDHVMAPTAQGGYSPYAIERMLILTNIAILEKAEHAVFQENVWR